MRALMVVALIALVIGGCGDNDNSDGAVHEVFVNGRVSPGTVCPAGTTVAYRDGRTLVCDACDDGRDCAAGESCHTQCGPGCEDDTGGCCPVRVCSAF